MSGQLALQVGVEVVVAPAMVWETLPIESQVRVTLRLARLLAALVEASRDVVSSRRGEGGPVKANRKLGQFRQLKKGPPGVGAPVESDPLGWGGRRFAE